MTTVTGKLSNPAGLLPARGAVAAVLIDYDGHPVLGFDVADHATILSTLPIPVGTDGTWTVDLVPNAGIQLVNGSAQTAWSITETGGGSSFTFPIIVPSGGPYQVEDLRTTLVGTTPSATPANLAVAGDLAVGGTLTLDTVAVGAPPNDPLKFLGGDGGWHVPGGGPPSGAAGGDLTGSSYPNPLLASTANVHAIIDARIPAALPPNGAAGGDLAGTFPAPTLAATANVNGIIRATRLDQLAAPTAAVPMNGQKITGGAAGTAGTDFAIVSQIPTSSRDPYTSMLGLASQPYPLDATNNDDLGASAGFLILALNRPGAGPITNLGLWLKTAGTGPGAASMALFSQAGARLDVTGDMSAALTTSLNNNTYVEAALSGGAYTAADATDYYVGLFTNLSVDPKIAGIFSGSGLHIPAVKGNRAVVVVGGLSSMPASVDIAGATTAGAAYWLVAS